MLYVKKAIVVFILSTYLFVCYCPWRYNTHNITTIWKTLAKVDQEVEIQLDGKLLVYIAFCHKKILSFSSGLWPNYVIDYGFDCKEI